MSASSKWSKYSTALRDGHLTSSHLRTYSALLERVKPGTEHVLKPREMAKEFHVTHSTIILGVQALEKLGYLTLNRGAEGQYIITSIH